MPLADLLARIDELQARIIAAGPLSPEAKRKLDYRFRLDWNYHSNVMEGSSLTKLETRTIMLGNVTVDGKPIKDVLEMKGHDDLITKLLQMSSGELQLSEARIKEFHKAIVKEDDPEKKEWVGHWKSVPNYLTNYRGERIDFTPPDQVAEAMHQLLDRTKADIERIERKAPDAPHPALLAFDFHREYVTIHPFHDGNGRTARIFSNLLLMRFGLPPVIVKVEEKETYNRFLAEVQVYGASSDMFNEFMAEKLERSLVLVVNSIEGVTIDESDDLDKEIALFKKELSDRKGPRIERNARVLATLYMASLKPLLQELIASMSSFKDMFMSVGYHAWAGKDFNQRDPERVLEGLFDEAFDGLLNVGYDKEGKLLDNQDAKNRSWAAVMEMPKLTFQIYFKGFRMDGTNTFAQALDLDIRFEDLTYSIVPMKQDGEARTYLYNDQLSSIERSSIIDYCKREFFTHIRSRVSQESGRGLDSVQ